MVRSCHKGLWRLSSDSEHLTPGRYYYVSEKTPAYPGWHALGSQYWYDTNWPLDPIRGEIPGPTTWDPGYPPSATIKEVSIGCKDCIGNGPPLASFVSHEQIIEGFLAGCIDIPNNDLRDWLAFGDWASCQIQRFYLYLLSLLDPINPAAFIDAILLLADSDVFIDWLPSQGLMPAVLVIVNPEWTVIVQNGTETNQQLAVQAVTGLTPGTDFGIGKTMPLWWTASTRAIEFAEASGWNPTAPVLVVGHSYGAAVAHLVSARLRAGQAERDIRYLCFASPKPGDQSIHDWCALCDGISINNHNDVVTLLPPDLNDAWLIVFGVSALVLRAAWNPWRRAPNWTRQDHDGTLHPNDPPLIDSQTAIRIAASALAHRAIDISVWHRIPSYRTRAQLRCPDCHHPINDELCNLMHWWGPDAAAMGLGRVHPVDESALVLASGLADDGPGSLVLATRAFAGETCEESLQIESGSGWSGPWTYGVGEWFYVDVPADTDFHLQMYNLGGDWTWISIFTQCGGGGFIGQAQQLQTRVSRFGQPTAYRWYIFQGSLTFGSGNYAFDVGPGL